MPTNVALQFACELTAFMDVGNDGPDAWEEKTQASEQAQRTNIRCAWTFTCACCRQGRSEQRPGAIRQIGGKWKRV